MLSGIGYSSVQKSAKKLAFLFFFNYNLKAFLGDQNDDKLSFKKMCFIVAFPADH